MGSTTSLASVLAPVLAPVLVRGGGGVVGSSVTATDGLHAGIAAAVAILLAVAVHRLLLAVLSRGDSERLTARLLARLAAYAIGVVGVLYALAVLDIHIGPLLGALGIGGIALALATQDILANAVDGILLELRRPFRRGDQVASGDHSGTVIDVNLRTVVLRTFDGERVHIPNRTVYSEPIVNYTRNGRRRTTLALGVEYSADLGRVKQVIRDAVRDIDGLHTQPAPEVWVEEFGESSINLVVRFWHAPDNATLWRVRDAVAVAVKQAFDREGLTIPFPQRVLWPGQEQWHGLAGTVRGETAGPDPAG